MITVDLFSIHEVSAGSEVVFSDAVVHSPGLFRPFSLAPVLVQNDTSEGECQGAAPPGRVTMTRDLMRFVFCYLCQQENLEQFHFCWKCGVQPVRSLPAPRYPRRPPVVVDVEKLQARRHQVLAANGRESRVTTEKYSSRRV